MPARYTGSAPALQPVRSNQPQLFQSLAARLSAFSEREEDRLDKEMAKKAKEKGLMDAQGKTAITLRDGNTIADEAWNEGAAASHLAAIKNDIAENHARIYEENKANPGAIREMLKGYGSGLLEGVPDQIKPIVQDQLASSGLRNILKAETELRTAQRNEQIANTNTALDTLNAEMLDALDSGDMEAATEREAEMKAMIDAVAAADPAMLDDAVKKKAAIDKSINRQIVIGEFKKALDEGKDDEFLKKFSSKKLGKTFHPDDREKLVTEMISLRNRRKVVLGIRKENVSKDIARTIKAARNGYKINPSDIAQVRQDAAAVGKLEEFERALDDIEKVNHFSTVDQAQRTEELDRLEASGEIEDYDKWAALKKADSDIRDAAIKDGYLLGIQQGIIEQEPIDITKPETFAARAEQAKFLSAHYGVEVSAFMDAEVTQFTQALPQMTPQEQAATAVSLAALGDSKVFRDIAKKGAPVFSMAAGIGDPQIMETIFTGQRELNLGNVKPLSREDYIADMNDHLKGVYAGENLEAVRKAALAHYAATDVSGIYDPDAFEASLDAVTGGIGEINNSPIELPRGVSERSFEKWVDKFSAEAVAEIGGVDGRTNEDAARMIREGQWINKYDAPGYIIRTRFGDLFQNGKPLVIQYNTDLPFKRPKSRAEMRGR